MPNSEPMPANAALAAPGLDLDVVQELGDMRKSTQHGKPTIREKGQAIVLIVLAMTALLGITAVAVDGGRMYYGRRTAQNGADNAALSAALERCNAKDAAPIIAAAFNSAAVNGFDNNGTTNTVVVNYPPSSGPNIGDDEHVEVIITSTQQASFARVLYPNDLQVAARAVARCRESFDYAVIALDTRNDVRGLQVVGDGDLLVNNGGVMVNSSHPTQALYEDGSGILEAEMFHVNGGVTGDGFSTGPDTGVDQVADPLADLPPPPKPAPGTTEPPGQGQACVTPHGWDALDANFTGSKIIVLNPGLYCRIRGDSGVQLILNPGIYYIDGLGSLEVTANSTISGIGVMIYLSPTAGAVTMLGNAYVNLSAPTSGPYAGMLFYADRNYTKNISMTGNSAWNAVGTIYAAGSYLDLSGNADVNNLSSMMIARAIKLGGNSDLVVNYDPGLNVTPPSTVSLAE